MWWFLSRSIFKKVIVGRDAFDLEYNSSQSRRCTCMYSTIHNLALISLALNSGVRGQTELREKERVELAKHFWFVFQDQRTHTSTHMTYVICILYKIIKKEELDKKKKTRPFEERKSVGTCVASCPDGQNCYSRADQLIFRLKLQDTWV